MSWQVLGGNAICWFLLITGAGGYSIGVICLLATAFGQPGGSDAGAKGAVKPWGGNRRRGLCSPAAAL
jgi:hypothetical protein